MINNFSGIATLKVYQLCGFSVPVCVVVDLLKEFSQGFASLKNGEHDKANYMYNCHEADFRSSNKLKEPRVCK